MTTIATTPATPTTPMQSTRKGKHTPVVTPVPVASSTLGVTVEQAVLKRALKRVSHAIGGGSMLPILSNVLLQSDHERGLKLQATNLELGITVWLSEGVTITGEGATTLTAKLLSDVVGSLPEEKLILHHHPQNETTMVQCDRFETRIHGIEAAEFPPIPTGTGLLPTTTMDAELVRTAIEQVAFAAATDDTRPTLTGVLLTIRAGTATLAAADGFRLARKTIPLSQPVQQPVAAIIPARALIKLAALLSNVTGEIEIRVAPSASQVIFSTQDMEVVTRVIEGQFPDIERVIPTQHETGIEIETAELTKAVKLASYFAAASSQIVRLTAVARDAGQLTITANAAEVGDNTGTIACVVHGSDGQIALNVKFLTEALSVIGGAQVRLELQSPHKPALLRSVGDESYIHLIMPMTVR